jgi:hypothetical protein
MKLYSYRHTNFDRPDWGPLQEIALRALRRLDVASIHPGDFMWMGELESLDGSCPLHLYKHIHTRSYLNIDTDLRMYAYVDDGHDLDKPMSEAVVHYRRLRGIATAIARLDLDRLGLGSTPGPDDLPPNVVPFNRRRGGTVA